MQSEAIVEFPRHHLRVKYFRERQRQLKNLMENTLFFSMTTMFLCGKATILRLHIWPVLPDFTAGKMALCR